MSERLCDHLETNGILDERQTAYRRNHSCETALTFLFDYALQAASSGKVTVLVLLDLSAAFDCVNHGLMAIILQKCGIEGDALNWLKSYLTAAPRVSWYVNHALTFCR